MRLSKIKLAGFKSFVDPTVFHVPGSLVGIVGPNGCGKSNIIDAVRWVMGESSVRNLRGDSMADVIFSGSSSRKPVGQAFVELSFDNSEGRLGGPYARYSEIAIRRLVERDGQSQYFLNGARCRRRDIVDIFLGTGLGPRSYAIIGQDMISRIIEAKPEELRIFLEEAAGISRYKERRRETENRIRHTRENLERLNDLRDELNRRLQQLQRQAQAAERYKRYKAEERRLRAELLALRWRDLDTEVKNREHAIRDRETALEAVIAEQRSLETKIEAGRAQQSVLAETLNQAQARNYEIGAEIARLEQTLTHRRELRQRQQEELQQIDLTLTEILAQIDQDQTRLAELETALSAHRPALESAEAAEAEADERLAEAEAAMGAWQTGWDDFGLRAGESQRLADVERTRIEHLERQLVEQQRRIDRSTLERDGLAAAGVEEELEALRQDEEAAAETLFLNQQQLAAAEESIGGLRETQSELRRRLDHARESIQAARGRLASLETLQEAALGRREGVVQEWLRQRRLDAAPRLAEKLEVEAGWERAVETVLGLHLEAVCVDDLEPPAAALAELDQGSLALFDVTAKTPTELAKTRRNGALADKVRAPWPLLNLFSGIETVADLQEALRRRRDLNDGESLVTPDGAWLGRDWLRVARDADDKAGVLAREREIQILNAALTEDEQMLESDLETSENTRTQLQELEKQRSALQEEINRSQREQVRLESQAGALQERAERQSARLEALGMEIEELRRRTEQDEAELREARSRLEEALLAMEQVAEERETRVGERETLRAVLEERRAAAADARVKAQQQALTLESARANRDASRQALARLESQRRQLQNRQEYLQSSGLEDDDPALRASLEERLNARLQAEADLEQARKTVDEQEGSVKALEKNRAAQEQQAQSLRQDLEEQRLGWREASVRRQTLVEQLRELEADPLAVLAETAADATETAWQAELEKIGLRIQRLGAINLAAIEEFEQVSERKRYLDAQNNDLVEALSTLEDAMRKIDRETRSRFQDTFDKVDAGFKELFPRLFGGGRAHLDLSGEDLLDAGVSVMARPPGKRIGSIHLLSGGEKALTAVSLVFSIFRLNPAPFCLLDEVDAPLDEANVGRFGNLLQEMSEQVQFIFITHNKATMEIARHLTGVTMHEPGVSRLVAVDVDEAVRLAVA